MEVTDYSGGFAGADWLRATGIDVPPFSALVADILGFAWKGMNHLPASTVARGHWKATMVEITIPGSLATFDGPPLTELVVLCHAAAVRMEISPSSHRYMRLQFWPRTRIGNRHERHPTLAQACDEIRHALEQRVGAAA